MTAGKTQGQGRPLCVKQQGDIFAELGTQTEQRTLAVWLELTSSCNKPSEKHFLAVVYSLLPEYTHLTLSGFKAAQNPHQL